MTTQQALSRLEVLRGLRLSIWEGIWATVWVMLTTGAFQIGFARHLGASDFVLGLLAALPSAVGLLQIPASLYVERRGERKGFVSWVALAGRLCWLLILLIPFIPIRSLWIPAFLFLLALSSALMTAVVPGWTSWMSDLVPADGRGRYFAQRNMLAGLVTMLVPLPAAAFLDQGVKYGRFDPSVGFAVLFGLAGAAGGVAFVLIRRQPEPPVAPRDPATARVNPFRSLAQPLADANFRRFITYAGCVVVGQTFAGQFFVAWQVDRAGLNLPYLTVQVLGAIAAGAGLAATPAWGYLTDKYGSRPLLILANVLTIASPLAWVFTLPRPEAYVMNIVIITLLNIASGVAWAGVGLAQFNLLLSTASPAARGTYTAVFSALTGVIGGVAPILGGALMEALSTLAIPLGFVVLNNYKVLFLLTALIRVGAVFLLMRVEEPEGRSTRYVLEQLTSSARSVSSLLQLRRLSAPVGATERERAIEQIGELRTPLAVEELVAALDDVSFDVRESAARALGEIRDSRAIPALGMKLLDPSAAIGEAAAEALGQIGNTEATPVLMAAAWGEDARVKVASLKALARIADPEALPVLRSALSTVHPTACEAACDAVAAVAPKLGVGQARGVVEDGLLPLLDPGPAPRGIRFAAARALIALARVAAPLPAAADALLVRLAAEPDPSVAAQVAVAAERFGIAAGRSPETLTAPLLEVLDRRDMGGLAYKQTLEAVAETGLEDGALYPYLGLAEMARDEMVTRLIGEVRRTLRPGRRQKIAASGGDASEEDAGRGLDRALEAYVEGRYAPAVRALAEVAALHGAPRGDRARIAASVLGTLARRPDDRDARPEEFLLALLLLKQATAPTPGAVPAP